MIKEQLSLYPEHTGFQLSCHPSDTYMRQLDGHD